MAFLPKTLSRLRNLNPTAALHLLIYTSLCVAYAYFFKVKTVETNWFAFGLLLCVLSDWEEYLKAIADPREPPLIPNAVPYIGHIVGIFRYGAKYYEIVNQRTQYPIYTLRTFTARNIIVTSATLAAPIQRASKALSFYSMILEVTKRLVAFDEPTMRIIRDNVNREAGDHGLMPESHDMIASELSPGPILNAMSTTQLEKFSEIADDIALGEERYESSLMTFVKEVFTVSNAYAIYGPENPFAVHPNLTKDFWVYENGMIPLMADIIPAITARQPYLARKRILAGLQEFVETENYKKASPIIQKRVSINLKHGLTTEMAGHAELILLFGIVGNAVPTTFWLLANIFARSELLAQIREEASRAVSQSENGNEKEISVETLKTSCPLLVSTYRETLRTIANLSSVRYVLSDTMVSGYLLKRGSIVQIASGILHSDDSVWGPDAKVFNPRRFMSSTSDNIEQFSEVSESGDRAGYTATQLPKSVPSAAYRAFGGGSVICPGRHFAQSEIVGFAALVALSFEIEGHDGTPLKLPERDDTRIPLSVMKPAEDVVVRVKRRKDEETTRWKLVL